MRKFHSYGPVDARYHFCVERKELIGEGVKQLVGIPDEGGHYFTIWAPRQTGKTWLMQQVKQEIARQYGDKFELFDFSLGSLRGMRFPHPESPDVLDFPHAFSELLKNTLPGRPEIKSWGDFNEIFSKERGLWDRPLVLFIDEVDTIPAALIDLLLGQFREMYLHRENNCLHGLALIGVRAVLGVDSDSGSPFNIQRSLHIQNFSREEVDSLFNQYRRESGQKIAPGVVEKVYKVTRGQPGLVCWFGELLTEKYNPGADRLIDMDTWDRTYLNARSSEWNNTIQNLIAKGRREPYRDYVLKLFIQSDLEFSIDKEWCSYLYMNGIIDEQVVLLESGIKEKVCRFSSPFIQNRLYHALADDLIGDDLPIPPLDYTDELADVFGGKNLNIPALLGRYKDYLKRLKAKGINPWREQARRKTDLHLSEAVGHFHLYSWLKEAVWEECVVSPEFPTGNGKVDLHLRCGEKIGIIEVKSYISASKLQASRKRAAEYGSMLGLSQVTLAVFLSIDDESVLAKLSSREVIDHVQVDVVAIGWR